MLGEELIISKVHAEANETICVELEVPTTLAQKFEFRPGQYLTFVADIYGTEMRRSYSICSAIGQPLAVAIKKIDGGVFSQFAHANFCVGMVVNVLPPDGNFTVPPDETRSAQYLCIAAGSGITPIISIVESVLACEPESRVTLVYGNRRSAEIIFKERLLWLKNRYMQRLQWINIFSQEYQDAPILNGRIDNRKGGELNRCLINIDGYDEFFLCGPVGMISEVSRGLRAQQIDESQIHYELFFASPEDARMAIEKHQQRARHYAGLTTQVSVMAQGRQVQFELSADGENILDGALANGLDLPYSCKGGVCATCKARLIEGQVDLDLNHVLADAELEAGYILTCQAHPLSDRVVVDFNVL